VTSHSSLCLHALFLSDFLVNGIYQFGPIENYWLLDLRLRLLEVFNSHAATSLHPLASYADSYGDARTLPYLGAERTLGHSVGTWLGLWSNRESSTSLVVARHCFILCSVCILSNEVGIGSAFRSMRQFAERPSACRQDCCSEQLLGDMVGTGA